MTETKTLSEKLEKFSQPCFPQEIEWKIQTFSKNKPIALVVPYLKKSACITRLDRIIGIANWQNSMTRGGGASGQGGFVCEIKIKDDEGSWVGRSDAGEDSAIAAFKGGASDAFKRASKMWGFGRDLDSFPTIYIDIDSIGQKYAKITDNQMNGLNAIAKAIKDGEEVRGYNQLAQ